LLALVVKKVFKDWITALSTFRFLEQLFKIMPEENKNLEEQKLSIKTKIAAWWMLVSGILLIVIAEIGNRGVSTDITSISLKEFLLFLCHLSPNPIIDFIFGILLITFSIFLFQKKKWIREITVILFSLILFGLGLFFIGSIVLFNSCSNIYCKIGIRESLVYIYPLRFLIFIIPFIFLFSVFRDKREILRRKSILILIILSALGIIIFFCYNYILVSVESGNY